MQGVLGAKRKFVVDDTFKLEQLHTNSRPLIQLDLTFLVFVAILGLEIVFNDECLQNCFGVCLLRISCKFVTQDYYCSGFRQFCSSKISSFQRIALQIVNF